MAPGGRLGKIATPGAATHKGATRTFRGDMMAALSISRAWDETKARIAADGKLFVIVAAAFVALPALIAGVIAPGSGGSEPGIAGMVVILLVSLVAIIGQLAIIRLAIGPSISVGEAIAHGALRMPVYLLAAILLFIAIIVGSLPLIALLVATGVELEGASVLQSSLALILGLLYLVVVCFVAVRLALMSPVASEERVGPIGILKRSWELTAGNWWRLFGFLLLFIIGAVVLMAAVSAAFGAVAVLLLGPVESLSASALLMALIEAILNAGLSVLLAVMLARIYLQLAGRPVETVGVPSSEA